MTESLSNIILLDLGTGWTKIGLSNTEMPIVIPSIVGFPQFALADDETANAPIFGKDALDFQGTIVREKIFEKQIIKNMDILFSFLKYCFQQINCQSGGTLVLGVSMEWSNESIYRLKTFLFQEFNFSAIMVEISEYFAFLTFGISTGCVLNLGYYQSLIYPFNDNRPVLNAIVKTDLGGLAVTNTLKHFLNSQFKYIQSSFFDKFAEEIKIEKIRLCMDLEEYLSHTPAENHVETVEVPKFKIKMSLGIEKYLAPEILFDPELGNYSTSSIDNMVIDSVKLCHPTLRRVLYNDIILVGGSANIPNIVPRLHERFKKIPLLINTKIHREDKPEITIWRGMQKCVSEGLYLQKAQNQTDFFAQL